MRIGMTRFSILFLCCLSLISCGGGGGGGGITNPPPTTNGAPRFTSATSFTFDENEVVRFVVSVSDPDGDTVTISEVGTGDGGLFQLNATTGEVTAQTANGAFNYENPLDGNQDNVYVQSFNLSDGKTTVTQSVSVTITNVIEPPRYLGATEFEAGEGVIGFAISATDDDSSVLEYTLNGPDASAFAIENGNLNFVSAPDFENPADSDSNNAYEISLTISNSEATIDVNLTATITNVDEPPVCESAGVFEFAENTSGSIYTFSAVDPEGDVFTFDNFLITAENLIFENLSLDANTGVVSLAQPIDFEALVNPTGQLSVTVGESTCSASFSVTDEAGTVTSGLKIVGSAVNVAAVGDVNGDGVQDLWLTTESEGSLQGSLVFGDYLANAMPAAALSVSTASANEVLPIQISATQVITGSETELVGYPIGDVDGDNVDELLLAFTTCEGCSQERAMAYLIWGSTLQNISASSLILDQLSQNQVLPISFRGQASATLAISSGDYDGDGRADIAFGLPSPVEESFVVFGDFLAAAKASGSTDLSSAEQNQVLDLNIDYLSFPFAGKHMASVGDIDGDTRPELVLTANQWVFVVYSSTIDQGRTNANLDIGVNFDLQINATSGVKGLSQQSYDLEGDGIPEIVWSMPSGGLASVAIGSTYDTEPNAKFVDDRVNRVTSGGITTLDDVSGDGFNELVLSLRTSVQPEIYEARIITGEALNAVANGFFVDLSTVAPGESLRIGGLTAQDSLQPSITGFSDLDGDGRKELIVIDGTRGELYVIRGADMFNALSAGASQIDMNELFNKE